MSKRVVAIIQARMNSTRLPGKVLRKILGKPLLFYLTDRIKKCLMIDEIIIATTETIRDDEIVNFCKQNNLNTREIHAPLFAAVVNSRHSDSCQ